MLLSLNGTVLVLLASVCLFACYVFVPALDNSGSVVVVAAMLDTNNAVLDMRGVIIAFSAAIAVPAMAMRCSVLFNYSSTLLMAFCWFLSLLKKVFSNTTDNLSCVCLSILPVHRHIP